MGIYVCEQCGEYRDDDWDIGREYKDGLICESCIEEVLGELEELVKVDDDVIDIENTSEEEQLKWYSENC